MLHITLTTKTPTNDPAERTFYGWGEQDTIEENWRNNCCYWALGARAHRESYVLFSHKQQHEVVMAAKIDKIILRIGVYELMVKRDVPPKVAINEALVRVRKSKALTSQ